MDKPFTTHHAQEREVDMSGNIRRRRAIAGVVAVTLAAFVVQGTGLFAEASANPVRHQGAGTVRLASLSVGRVLVDAQGRTLYVFSSDKHHEPTCKNACAAVWPPLLAGHVHAVHGVKKKWLGTVKTSGGKRQVTYHHWPLYTYVGDTKSGEATGQGLNQYGGTWSTISGNAKTHFGTTASSSSSTGSGGYGSSGSGSGSGGGW